MKGEPEQRCYEAFVAAIADAIRLASPALVADPTIDHEDMLTGLASAHLQGVAAAAAAVARVTGRPVDWIVGTMITSLRQRARELVADVVPA